MIVESRGVPLAVHDFGGPVGAPVLMWLHANGLAATAYTPFLRKVAQRARVFALDLRGHGESGAVPLPLEEHLTLAVLESDLGAVLEAVGTDAPALHLAAHSVGGLPVVRHLSGAGVEVASATLFEAAVYPPPAHPVRADAEKLTAERVARTPRRRAQWPAPAEFADALAKAPAFAAIRGAARLELAEALLRPEGVDYSLRCDPLVETFLFTQVARAEEFDMLAGTRCPVLVVAGDNAHAGATWVTHMQADIARAIPGSRFERMQGAGHLLPLEAPEACASLLHEWIAQHDGGSYATS